jgi:FAD/FMN-containing dehydrogenase/Fe-S oxidoreductase
MARTVRIPAKAGDARFGSGMGGTQEIDVKGLASDLARAVGGEVRFDALSRALYATDSSNFRQPPIGVVIPRTVDDVVAAHRVCHDYGAPITPRGTGTSLSGETVNYAVILDVSKYLTAIGDPDTESRTVVVEPGAINEKVNLHTGRWNLIFGPDPSTHAYCCIGGNLGNNSCGIHSVQSQFYGPGARTSDNVESLDIVTYDGVRMTVGATSDEAFAAIVAAGGRRAEIYAALRALRDRYAGEIRARFPTIPRRVSGYNLDDLLPEKGFNVARALVGTEGTCATVLRATLKLTPGMLKRALVAIAYDDIYQAGDQVPRILEFRPIGLEGIDHELFQNEMFLHIHPRDLSELPQRGSGWLLVEFGADDQDAADGQAQEFVAAMVKEGIHRDHINLFEKPAEEAALWRVREGGLGATAFPPDGKDHWPGWEDSAVPPERVGPYLRDLKKLYDRYGLHGAFYGHFGQGCIHSRISFDLRTAGGMRTYRSFMEAAADLVVSYGGSLSGEHGDGQQRAELLPRMYGERLVDAFRQFKAIWDPQWKMNPGKVVDPYRLDENLKLGTGYNPWRPQTVFAYGQDGGDFAHATLRCVGVGKCRIPDTDNVMCPSFQVLHEETHTTRGRARLLFEMLQGDVITDGWRSGEVKEALDLCLACKGCTNDCPVSVDLPTYKAEFLHHHYEGRLRPRYAYAMGLIDKTAAAASRLPGMANLLGQAPGVSALVKLAGGVTQQRRLPSFAPLTLRDWFARRPPANLGGPKVLLWPDTFNNFFHTDVGVAGVEALEAAGYQVVMPRSRLCCGRPLYDYGFLDLARRYLLRVLDGIREEIRAGTPVVGLEPSCLAVFKEELTSLLPHDDDAQRLAAQSYHFAEFLVNQQVTPPRLAARAVRWGHCHHKATGGMDPEDELLRQMGVDVTPAAGGCCGLAGSWGFEAGHHDLSMRIGEEGLLPAVRKAGDEALIVADGFSCRTQLAHSDTGRRALHLAQVMKIARERGAGGVGGTLPEQEWEGRRPPAPFGLRLARAGALGALGGAGLAGAALLALRRARLR